MSTQYPRGSQARREMLARAVEIARGIIAGSLSPSEGCTQIAEINAALDWPEELAGFGQLAHEQSGHEDIGITAENLLPGILREARALLRGNDTP